jgi:3',5'-cyclic-AMP phosphodiesterase
MLRARPLGMARWARSSAVLVASTLAIAGSCIHTTPFQSDPSVTDLTAKNLARLDGRRPAPQPFKFAALGDTHEAYDELARTVEALNARDDLEFLLIAGDLTTIGLLDEYEWSVEILQRLDIPFFTVVGNHDALSRGKQIYQRMFGPYDYSFSYGGLKFILFNSNTLEFEGAAPNAEWLRSEAARLDGNRGIVFLLHHDFRGPEDLPGGRTAELYAELAARHPVELVVHGHLEEFSLEEWRGVPKLQCGSFNKVFFHTIVTVEAASLRFERCRFERCEPVEPLAQKAMP